MDAVELPSASYVASPPESVVELSAIAGPAGVFFAYTPGPPFCATNIACEPMRLPSTLFESAYEIWAWPANSKKKERQQWED